MESSREQFETAIKGKLGDLVDLSICVNGDGEYLAWDAQVAWFAWQKSRAAIEIELPQKCGHLNMVNGRVMPEAASYDEAIDDCTDVLKEAGITVKGE